MTTNVESIKKQFLFDLADIYDAENRIARALPRMVKDDTSQELKMAILSHTKEIESHLSKVEQIFECFGEKARGNSGRTLGELLAADDEVTTEFIGSLSDAAGLIAALQNVESHEIACFGCQREWETATYGCLHEWVSLVERADAADLLEAILEEEKVTARSLRSEGRLGILDESPAGSEDDRLSADDRLAM